MIFLTLDEVVQIPTQFYGSQMVQVIGVKEIFLRKIRMLHPIQIFNMRIFFSQIPVMVYREG